MSSIHTPGLYIRPESEPTPEQLSEVKAILGEFSLIAVERNQPELLPFDPQMHGASLGEISKDEFVELVIAYHPRSKKTPNHFHNVLARNTWKVDEERKPFIKSDTNNINLDTLYGYLSTGKQTAEGGGELFHKVMTQVVNHKITELQTAEAQ